MTNTTGIDAKCTTSADCDNRAVAHDEAAGEFACADHLAQFTQGAAEFAAEQAPAYTGPRLVSVSGKRVHYPALLGQVDTSRTACAPYGRMGARQMRLWLTANTKWAVNCKACLRTAGPKAGA